MGPNERLQAQCISLMCNLYALDPVLIDFADAFHNRQPVLP